MELYVNDKLREYTESRERNGFQHFVFCGGRRSGKTFFICQNILLRCVNECLVVNIATMTQEQGRLGAFADFKTILQSHPALSARFTICEAPREIRGLNGSRIFFNSYQNSETAKGVACDILFVNEANNFSKQQYTDLLANVRKFVFLDYNPNIKFWVDDYFSETDICNSSWQDNPFLTKMQLQYFSELKRLAEQPNASAVDIRNYRIYYLGEYSELKGNIFTSANINFVAPDSLPKLKNFVTFSDPSALRGADFFASVLSATDDNGNVYILDSLSINSGGRVDVAKWLNKIGRSYDLVGMYVETNGLVGIDFFEFAQNSELPVTGWYSKGNKFERICAEFQNITQHVYFLDSAENREYVKQIYEFAQRCEHDDNVDAIASTVNLHKILS